MTVSEPPKKDDEKPSSIISKLKEEVKDVDFISVSSSHSMTSIGDVEIQMTGTNMRLLTRMSYKEEEELGVNNQGINKPLEVVHKHQFASSRYIEGECLKVAICFQDIVKIVEERE